MVIKDVVIYILDEYIKKMIHWMINNVEILQYCMIEEKTLRKLKKCFVAYNVLGKKGN